MTDDLNQRDRIGEIAAYVEGVRQEAIAANRKAAPGSREELATAYIGATARRILDFIDPHYLDDEYRWVTGRPARERCYCGGPESVVYGHWKGESSRCRLTT